MSESIACGDADQLQRLLDGGLTADEQETLSGHVETCSICQQTLDAMLLDSGRTWSEALRRATHSTRIEAPLDGVVDAAGSRADESGELDTREVAEVESLLRHALGVLAEENQEAGDDALKVAALHDAPLHDAPLHDTPLHDTPLHDAPPYLGPLGHYELLEVVGWGGMGVVYKALDRHLERFVAIKLMTQQLAASAAARCRFAREARAVAAVRSEHVIAVYAVEQSGHVPYIVMEYVEGNSLQQQLDREGARRLEEVLRIALQTAQGLAAAHDHGLVHRDIKPANILLESDTGRVKITDFGLARAADDASLTQTGMIAGTPQYMAPEQALGRRVDHRADLFSLGSVLYAMCTGRAPFRGGGSMATLRRVLDEAPRPIREVNPEIPAWLVEIIDRLHAKDPAKRYQSAAEVAEALASRLAELQSGEPPSAAPQAAPRRSPLRSALRWTAALYLPLLAGLAATELTGVTQFTATVMPLVTEKGTLVIVVDDTSVQVAVDGGEFATTQSGIHELPLRPGEHRIRAVKDGKLVRDELVTVSRGETRTLTIHAEQTSSVPAALAATIEPFAPDPLPAADSQHQAAEDEAKLRRLRELVLHEPDNAGLHYSLAVELHRQGRLAEAEAECRLIKKLDPNCPNTLLLNLLRQQGKLDEAEIELREFIDRYPDNPGGHYSLGLLLENQNRFEEAEAAYRKVLELQPGSIPMLHHLAGVLRKQGRKAEADAILEAAAEPAPNAPEQSH